MSFCVGHVAQPHPSLRHTARAASPIRRMVVACSLDPPSINLSSTRPVRRPPGVPSWGKANLTGIVNITRKQHPFDGLAMFKPERQSPDGWYGALFASQFREKCRRFLILEDDMNLAGFGWTPKSLALRFS